MRTAGIICEYNPFHRGHAWQISALRARLGGETAVVCAMSGDFVQRGDFAVMRAHARAEAAVRGGADLVLELPLPWAVSSAEGFAVGGVAVLAGTGVVDTLVFGSECGDAEMLRRAADCLLSPEFAAALRVRLGEGTSFAAARESTARALIGAGADVLTQPNDILGVEYCKAIARQCAAMEPLALPRRAVGHDGGAAESFASASHIRELADSYKEAQTAIEVGKVFDTEKSIINYENLGLGRLIYQLPTTLCEIFLSEVFKKNSIDALDQETLFTINKFFENNLNVSETSRKLFVHRNTLVYRLEKIKKLTGLDLREFDDAIIFKVALMVKKYLVSRENRII